MKKSCDDGYPSCRNAEATGQWCGNDCLHSVHKEIDELVEKRTAIREKMMDRFHRGSATRARTTTSNAEVDRINERLAHLRSLF